MGAASALRHLRSHPEGTRHAPPAPGHPFSLDPRAGEPAGQVSIARSGNGSPVVSGLVQPRLINGPFDDPGLFIDFRFGRRAFLFDLGDVHTLSARELMRVSDVFVSHTHMDHFAGFDRLLRLCLNRQGQLRLVGPEGFIGHVEHRLRSYTWNLLGENSPDFRLLVLEFTRGSLRHAAEFRAREAFEGRMVATPDPGGGLALDEPSLRVEAVELDHGIPVLAFALQERQRINVWRNALDGLGLPVGPWISEAKEAIRRGATDSQTICIPSYGQVALGMLRERVFRTGPGQRVVYVTDAAPHAENLDRITALAQGADQLFIEAAFLEEDAPVAQERRHLTAAKAGAVGRRAAVKHLIPFHFSPRYLDRPSLLEDEALAAFRGSASSGEVDAAHPGQCDGNQSEN